MEWDDEMSFRKNLKQSIAIRNKLIRIGLAEFLGTFILVLFGDASVAQYKLFDGLGTYLSVNWSWGIAVALGVWVCGGVSGGHINPAVSVAMALYGRISWLACVVYIIAQYIGAILAAAFVYAMYVDAIDHYEGGRENRTLDTAGIFATQPAEFVGWFTCLGDQIISTSMLVCCVMAITDKNNMKTPPGMVPFCVGLIVAVIGMSMGSNCGYAINPARDLGPRIFTAMAGWGDAPFKIRDYNYFWIPVVGPHIGAILGGWFYLLCVGIHQEAEAEREHGEDASQYQLEMEPPPKNNGSIEMQGRDNPAYI